MKLNAIQHRRSLGQDVFEQLKQAIITQDLVPGERLVESRLAETLGISRTPLREALHKLEREDWIEKMPSGGFRVVVLTREDIEETFGIRSVLEAYAGRLATENHTPSDMRELQKVMARYQQCLEKNQIQALLSLNTQFHDLLYALSRSPRLIRMIDQLRAQISRYRQIILKHTDFAVESCEDHARMLSAMAVRDADRVEALVREHILRGKHAVLQELETQDDQKIA
jgi:DNA-binding GntR family transcriptional regulator